jgi:hypothetical protein
MRASSVIGLALLLGLLAPSAYLAWRFRAMPHLGRTGDDQIYLVSAKSLAIGEGYRILNLAGSPHQTKFPVLYPFLLSLVWRLQASFPANLPAFLFFSWLAMPGFVLLARLIFRGLGFSEAEAWGMAAVVAVSPAAISAATSIGPDLWFSVLLLLVMLSLQAGEQRSAWHTGLSGVLGGLLYLLRTAAIPLLVTVPLYFVCRRKSSRAAFFLAGMLPLVLAWSIWARAHILPSDDPSVVFYTDYFRDFLMNFSWRSIPVMAGGNLAWLLEYSGLLTAFLPLGPWPWLCGLAAIGGALWLARRTGVTQYHLFAIAYCVMLVLWPGKPLLRYLLPLAPLLVAGFFYGVSRLLRFMAPAMTVTLIVLACGTALVGLPPLSADLARSVREVVSERQAYDWIRGNLPARARFVAAKDGVLYLETGRLATTYQPLKIVAYAGNQAAVREWTAALPSFARRQGAQYILCDARMCPGALWESDVPQARAVLATHSREVFRSGEVTIYRLLQ